MQVNATQRGKHTRNAPASDQPWSEPTARDPARARTDPHRSGTYRLANRCWRPTALYSSFRCCTFFRSSLADIVLTGHLRHDTASSTISESAHQTAGHPAWAHDFWCGRRCSSVPSQSQPSGAHLHLASRCTHCCSACCRTTAAQRARFQSAPPCDGTNGQRTCELVLRVAPGVRTRHQVLSEHFLGERVARRVVPAVHNPRRELKMLGSDTTTCIAYRDNGSRHDGQIDFTPSTILA